MESFIEILLQIYGVIVFIGLICSIFIVKNEAIENEYDKSDSRIKTKKWEKVFRIIIYILVFSVVVVSLICTVLYRFMWVIIPVTVFTLLERTNEVYGSLSVIHDTVNNTREDCLSKRETNAIIVLSSAVYMLNFYRVPYIIIQFTTNISNEILSDWLTVIVLVLLVTLYCFLIGVMIQFPLIALVRLIRTIKRKNPVDKIKKLEAKYHKTRTEICRYDFLSIKIVKWTLGRCETTRILWGC